MTYALSKNTVCGRPDYTTKPAVSNFSTLWRPHSKTSVFGDRKRCFILDSWPIGREKDAKFSNISWLVWTGPQTKLCRLHACTYHASLITMQLYLCPRIVRTCPEVKAWSYWVGAAVQRLIKFCRQNPFLFLLFTTFLRDLCECFVIEIYWKISPCLRSVPYNLHYLYV